MPNLVRCSSCAEIVPYAPECATCGAPLRRPVVAPPEEPTSFQERYRGTEFAAPPPVPLVTVGRTRDRRSMAFIGLGVAIIGFVAFTGIYVTVGPKAAPTERVVVVQHDPTPTPPPSLPPVAANTVAVLTDQDLSAKLKVRTQYDAKVFTSSSKTIVLEAVISGGNEQGKYGDQSFRTVAGIGYVKSPSDRSWRKGVYALGRARLVPLLCLQTTRDLQLIGEETISGQPAVHLRNTKYWNPDPIRMGLLTGTLPVVPDTQTLDLWVAADGTPLSARYVATRTSNDGTRLLNIDTTYEFSDIGVPVEIVVPK